MASFFTMLHFEPLVLIFCLALGEAEASLRTLNKVFLEEKKQQH